MILGYVIGDATINVLILHTKMLQGFMHVNYRNSVFLDGLLLIFNVAILCMIMLCILQNGAYFM